MFYNKKLILFAVFLLCLCQPDLSNAGAWTLAKGKLWLKTAVFYQSTSSRFCTGQDAQSPAFNQAGCTSAGHSAPFDPFVGGTSEVLVVYNEVTYGINGWFDLGIQIPFYSLSFTNFANPNRPRSNNFGDIRFLGKLRLMQKPLVASLTVAAKSPTGKFNTDAEVANVSEGQWDFDFLTELSKSFWPVPGYASIGFGYRIRTDNAGFEYTMADEINILAEIGFDILPGILIKGTLDWLRGYRPHLKATNQPLLERREIFTLTPGLIYKLKKNIGLEASVRFPVNGQDFPASPQFMAAVSYTFNIQ